LLAAGVGAALAAAALVAVEQWILGDASARRG
jgi:hypothetical protein